MFLADRIEVTAAHVVIVIGDGAVELLLLTVSVFAIVGLRDVGMFQVPCNITHGQHNIPMKCIKERVSVQSPLP